MKFLLVIIFSLALFKNALSISENGRTLLECHTYKRISIDDLQNQSIEIILNSKSIEPDSPNEPKVLNNVIKTIYSEIKTNISESLFNNESIFNIKIKSKNSIDLSVTDHLILNELVNRTFVFDLKQNCDLILDFYKPNINSFIDDLTSLINLNKDQSFIYIETNTLSTEIGLKKLLPKITQEAYSLTCLKCNLNNRDSDSVDISVINDVLKLRVEAFLSDSIIYNDVIILVEQAENKFYILIRVFKTDNFDHLIFNIEDSKRLKRYSSNHLKFIQSPNNKNSLLSSNANFNQLKPAQLAITEETVGLQTKLKIYDFVWVDYQLNASDYVKQRIQLIAPDNPILNITKPFDYETGGPMHTFQIIFTRKVDKRVIKDVKPITIKVIDINDEPPVWKMDEPVPYTAVVERDPRPGQLVFQFLAEDPDTQSEIVYTLHSKSPNTTRLVLKEGKLFTESGPPFQYDTYKILVSAYDAKAVVKSSDLNKTQEIFAELTIIVGKKAPQFYQSEYKVNISENAPIGYNVIQMRAKSFNPDPLNKKHLRYSLQTRQGQSAEFSIYSENGTVILARKVDYETDLREYNLIVQVTEQSGWLLSSTARLNIYIEDYNDNAPQFTLSEYVRNQPVPEDLNPDTFIIQVEVQDRDNGRNSEIEWQVSNPNFYIRPFSDSDTSKAKIYNEGKLDFEIPQHMYRFDVIACDKGEPKLCASAKVSVPISNVNDEKPKFDQKVILATLDENVPPGAYVTTVQATDGDGDRIYFRLKDESGPFEINRESGIVKVKSDHRIDPREDYYNLTIYAEDDGSCCCAPTSTPSGNRVHKLSYNSYSPNCKVKTNREEATLVIKIKDINDHAPKFHDCDYYSKAAQVEEEKPIGTKVIQVEAKDADKGENGEVEYEILSTHNNERNQPFKIDPITGLITTNMVFDRETNGKFNEYSITVKAKDKGKPHPLSDACSFRIKIIDINDHAPYFYEPDYKLSIKYGIQPGQIIHRIIASDADSGKNAEIKYRIEQAGPYAEYFDVDELTGMISLRKEISHNIKQPIIFNLIAEDQGVPSKSSSVSVSLSFADRDNEPPKWLPETEKRFERVVRIPEAISLNQVVETLDAESNYAPNSKLIFDFSPKPQPESFIIQQEKIPGTNRYRGKIIVYQPLDAETQNFYELHVRVQNAAAQPMEIIGVVKVEILDSNDNMPLFTSPTYLANVSENSPPGTYVTKVTAEDKDISAPNNLVIYSINDQEASRKFQIDPYTGNITTRVVLDREETKVYFIDITACDSAMSDRPNMNSPNCRSANVRIDVSDTNDNDPYFNYTLYEATVAENAERGTPIITVQANDLDENSQLRYLITDGNEDNVFGVRESIGEIYVANNAKLDYETLDEFLLTLTVSDGIHNATTKVKINLLDVNDNPPIFTENPPYEIDLIEEDLNFPRVILKINATDGDIKRPNTIVYKINYNYSQNGTSFRPFSINHQTGEIILQEKLDRDYPNGRPVWSFNVIASDEGGMKGSMDSTAVVNVRLTDINDNAPVFDRPPYIGHIMENSKPGSLIMTVTANDYDDPQMGQNAILKYQIAENKKFGNLDVFSINDTTGQIFQNLKLDREQIDKYTIEVCATDGSGKRGCGQVTIYVDDANDQAPQFQSNTYTETINEDFPIGERVLVVTATDKDIGINAELSYGLKSECLVRNSIYTGNDDLDCVDGVREPKYFKVDTEREANSGFVKLSKSVNYDPPDYHRLFKLNVSVSDGVHQNFTTVFINIADVNDEAPKFKEPVKNVPVYESIPPLTIITNFTAEDLDTNEMNRRFSYSLDRKSEGSHEFTIDQFGNLYNLEPLDREVKDKYILRIFAIDEGYPPQTGIATLNLEVLDVNDNFPAFAENYRPIIMENSPPGQFVSALRAKDLDSPDNGPPFTFELPDKLNVWPSRKDPKFNLSFHLDELNGDNHAKVYSLSQFDREGTNCGTNYLNEYDRQNQCKEFKVPVLIRDSGKPPQSGINYLTVTIGDVNDNLHFPGVKKILINDYKGSVTRKINMIGNVYSEDKDDWDASDKEFKFLPETDDTIRTYFDLVENINDSKYSEAFNLPGSIILKPGIQPGNYEFKVNVKDLTRPDYEAQIATVYVTIKTINEDLVQNSGSFRISGITAERLIETRYSQNEKSFLTEIQNFLAANVYRLDNEENLEFFSIMNHKTLSNTVDLRFSAHGSPIFKTEKLNGLLAHNKQNFQKFLLNLHPEIQLNTIGIDECADSEKKCKDSGCRSKTVYSNQAAVINSNQTSFVGVYAEEKYECVCKSLQSFSFNSLINQSCSGSNYCLNGGMCIKTGSVQKCQCPKGFDGPRCQKTIRSFNNSGGFAWLPSLPQCQDMVLSFEFITSNNKGLIFYNGPINGDVHDRSNPNRYQQDFIALQLEKGRLIFQIKQGINGKTHSYLLNNYNRSLSDENWHRVDIYKNGFKYRITIDRCIEDSSYPSYMNSFSDPKVSHKSSQSQSLVFINGCEHEIQVQIHDLFINTNQYYPLQLGGLYDKNSVPKTLEYKGNFVGCIRNLRLNGELYDLQIDTPRLQGFHMNSASSCPRADKHCLNSSNYCLNGICDANFKESTCVCKPGYRGSHCELKTLAFDFQTPGINKRAGSYLKYRYVYQSDSRNSAYDHHLKKHTRVQLLFRTRENTTDKPQTLFQITSPNRAQYVYLEILNNKIHFRYDIGGGESVVSIENVLINDGKWHFVKAERYGREASLTLDDGEGLKMNYTFGLPNGAKEMDVDRDSIFLGAKVVQIKVSGYEISRDYHDSCMMDVRFDGKPLPYLADEEREYEDIAIKMEAVNIKDGCQSEDYCKGIFCPSNQKCVDQWRLGECQCPKGQFLNGTKCHDLNDCQLCYHEGTKYCEKYDDNRVIAYENFQDNYFYESKSTIGDYPPDNWFISRELSSDFKDGINKVWRVTSDENIQASGFRCVCKKGYFGQYCNAQASRRAAVFMSPEAISIIVLCLIMSLFLILAFIVYARTKTPTPKHYMLGVDPHDEVRETIINYVEEGCPDVDQSSYDITQLAKPLDPTGSMSSHPLVNNSLNISDGSAVIDGEFQPAIPRQKPPLQEMNYIRRDVPPVTQLTGLRAHKPQNTEVGDFINNKLREIDNDPVQPPYDSLQEYAYEGEGSIYGSTLSALEINKLEDTALIRGARKDVDTLDSDLEQVKNWGPKFSKISTIYGLVSDEETNDLHEET
ncbi:unnamed protein product [Brachionus calyciflorus]|uniref:Uncharacterized protein n=1 Tax=Brachionus calyciflorus TaxID=104777 RepID=A0A813M1B8_9BILA|nr:unnamed protein product [Brachionus calyciflorus]